MKPQGQHGILPQQTPEEQARHSFQVSVKRYFHQHLVPAVRDAYEGHVKPVFIAREGREPKNRHEVATVMKNNQLCQMWMALRRQQQEQYVDSTNGCIERQVSQLAERFRSFADNPRYGSLKLNSTLEIPRYQSAVDIHCVPGSYFEELTADDVYPGARYDIGLYMYSTGAFGPYNDGMGKSLLNYIQSNWPDLHPKRILEMGCTSGLSLIPYTEAFPDANLHAIDLSAPCLRYAHARSESLGKSIHFSQQNAEHTNFESERFDLIISHILMHETSRRAVYEIVKEGYRLLKPGGLMIHLDVPIRNADLNPFDQFMSDFDTKNNNEPFWGTFHDMDLIDPLLKAGFDKDQIIETYTESVGGEMIPGFVWYVFGASKTR